MEVFYGTRGKKELEKVICRNCYKKHESWDKEIFEAWLKYINGVNRIRLIKGSRFSGYISLKYHFKKHPCYKKVAKIRKRWFRNTRFVKNISLINFPWLLGIYYADGSVHNKTQLSFSLSEYENIIADEILKDIRKLVGNEFHIVKEKFGNMINIRLHSVELCDKFPSKRDGGKFKDIWSKFSDTSKIKFIGGFVDGDGSCSFEDGIDSIHIYSKSVPFVLSPFKNFLKKYGYVSLKSYSLYMSPDVGKFIKTKTHKRYIKKPYMGKVDTSLAFSMLRRGLSVRKIAKNMDFDKKTILLALRRSYPKEKVEKYIELHRKK